MLARIFTVCLGICFPVILLAQEPAAPQEKSHEVVLADGGLTFQAPGNWTKVQPKINMIEAEFAIPKLETDPANGRVTVMASGGSIEQNIDRWKGQFSDAAEDAIKVSEKEVNKVKIHIVDITGTYLDTMGNPSGPKTDRENYRLLGAIIETPSGNYYVKCYGPAPTMEKQLDGFKKLVETVRVVD